MKTLMAGQRTHLGDLVGKELHDNSASGSAANAHVEEDTGVRHCDVCGCVGVVEKVSVVVGLLLCRGMRGSFKSFQEPWRGNRLAP
jgi:hypothetical protein